MVKIITIVKKFFFTFLDISGILLGVFLIGLGVWIIIGRVISVEVGYVITFLGVAAFFIHVGHYFHLTIARWIFGPDTYFYKDSSATKTKDDRERD